MSVYKEIVMSCTSYFDAKDNAYHMLFLGMCISLRGLYKVTSNLEMGLGRSDISLEALHQDMCHIVIEFKQGVDLVKLKKEALGQIMENHYYAGLRGKVLCLGIAHNKKECDMAWEYAVPFAVFDSEWDFSNTKKRLKTESFYGIQVRTIDYPEIFGYTNRKTSHFCFLWKHSTVVFYVFMEGYRI